MKKFLMLFILASIIAFTGLSFGETIEDEKQSSKSNVVVVTATRSDQNLKKVPANVTVITEEDIAKSNAKVISDVLRFEEGVVVSDWHGNGKKCTVDLRGFGETGAYNTLVLVDGRRVNSIDLGGVDWTQIPINQVERIEIVRGAGSVLYGDNAVGGVINIITKSPSQELKAKGKATFGSYRFDKQEASISGGYKSLSGAMFASQHSTDGYRHDNEFKAWDAGGKLFFDPTDIISFHINGSYHEDEYDMPRSLTYSQQKANRKANPTPNNKGKTKDFYISSGFNLNFGKYGNLITDVTLRNQNTEFNGVDWMWFVDTEIDTRSFSPRYILKSDIFGHNNTFITGVDLYWTEFDADEFSPSPSDQITIVEISRDSMGFYFNNEFSILENLLVSFGARYEQVDYDFYRNDLTGWTATLDDNAEYDENAFNAGLTYLYHDDSSVFVQCNRSFRYPLTDELIVYDTFFNPVLNPDLKPQTGIHYEAGIRHHFTPDIRSNITYFRAEIEDEIYLNPVPFRNENHPETLHQGVELGFYADVFDFLSLFGNYTYEKATFEKDPYKNNDIPGVPRHKGNVGFKIHDIIPGLVFSTDCNIIGSSYAISDQANAYDKVDPYYTLNMMLSYEWKMFEVFAGVNNLTNKKYSEYIVAGASGLAYYPSPERNYFGGLSIEF